MKGRQLESIRYQLCLNISSVVSYKEVTFSQKNVFFCLCRLRFPVVRHFEAQLLSLKLTITTISIVSFNFQARLLL